MGPSCLDVIVLRGRREVLRLTLNSILSSRTACYLLRGKFARRLFRPLSFHCRFQGAPISSRLDQVSYIHCSEMHLAPSKILVIRLIFAPLPALRLRQSVDKGPKRSAMPRRMQSDDQDIHLFVSFSDRKPPLIQSAFAEQEKERFISVLSLIEIGGNLTY